MALNPGVSHEGHPLGQAGRSGGPSPCDWEPSTDGRWLCWVDVEKSNNAIPTLQFLIDHFLRPGAYAHADGRPEFAAFTFDHMVSGTIAAERDDGELFLIVAEDNELEPQVLVPGSGLW